MKKWKTLEKIKKGRSIIFEHEIVKRSSQSGISGNFDIIHCLDWVNILPVTENEEVILVKQYRHGTDQITYEIPGGAIERGEEPLNAAKRELKEETGYASRQWHQLGMVDVNPAFMSNKCFFFLAKGAQEVSSMQLDPLEEIEIEKVCFQELEKMVSSGAISHSLVLNALYFYGRNSTSFS